MDPEIDVRETKNQIDDLMGEVRGRVDRNERVLVTTLTKKMSEDLTDYLLEMGFRVRYLHSEIDTLERIQIIRELRLGEYDVLVGVNLLREGLDLPEVSLVAILDADKEGFLRGETSLIQTIGRAARNVDGKVLMYADKETEAMRRAIAETDRRRAIQRAYNAEHGITPETIVKGISDITEFLMSDSKVPTKGRRRRADKQIDMTPNEIEQMMRDLEEEMLAAAEELRFEYAAKLRDEIRDLRRELDAATAPADVDVPHVLPLAGGRSARRCSTRCCRCCPPACTRGRDTVSVDLRRAVRPGGARGRRGPWRSTAGPSRRCRPTGATRRDGGGRRDRRPRVHPLAVGSARRAEGVVDVVVERRGSAFGSGSHPTTQMCVSLMLELSPEGGAADLGCGVGTLAIVAAKLGWAPVVGVDRVPVAIEVGRENVARNGVAVDAGGGRPRGRRRAAGAAAAGQRAAAGAGARRGVDDAPRSGT